MEIEQNTIRQGDTIRTEFGEFAIVCCDPHTDSAGRLRVIYIKTYEGKKSGPAFEARLSGVEFVSRGIKAEVQA